MSETVQVCLVDDEPDVTRSLCWLLESVHVAARAFHSADEFLAALPALEGPQCLVLDLRMPGTSGLELMEKLVRARPDIPVVFLSAHGDVPSAVRAMKLGAFDFLQKPFNPQAFLEIVNRCSALARERHAEMLSEHGYASRFALLSPREKEVFARLITGESSKEIARRLEISHKTVEVHRANVLRKFDCATTRELEMRFGKRLHPPVAARREG
ncbi:MAG: response regulator transcription factor [Gammaproteobacteria bacterium]|nr:response regulator transcription factor [Gammaproteobacteria bacterium]